MTSNLTTESLHWSTTADDARQVLDIGVVPVFVSLDTLRHRRNEAKPSEPRDRTDRQIKLLLDGEGPGEELPSARLAHSVSLIR